MYRAFGILKPWYKSTWIKTNQIFDHNISFFSSFPAWSFDFAQLSDGLVLCNVSQMSRTLLYWIYSISDDSVLFVQYASAEELIQYFRLNKVVIPSEKLLPMSILWCGNRKEMSTIRIVCFVRLVCLFSISRFWLLAREQK